MTAQRIVAQSRRAAEEGRGLSVLAVLFCLLPGGCRATSDPAAPLIVHAASSLTEVLPKLALAWEADGGGKTTFSFESSARLARQIAAGAPGDVFVSADLEWMDDLDERALLKPGTRRPLAGNRLVVVVPAGATAAPADLRALGGISKLALAGDGVPAGRYARAALERHGVLDAMMPRVVSGDSVRTTLAWVARGEADAAIVYATDARVEPRVRIAFEVPEGDHAPVVYPGAVLAVSGQGDRALAFLEFCRSEAGQAIFRAAGFGRPPP